MHISRQLHEARARDVLGHVPAATDRNHRVPHVMEHQGGDVDHREHLTDVNRQVVAHQLRRHVRGARAAFVPSQFRSIDRPRLALEKHADDVARSPPGFDRLHERIDLVFGHPRIVRRGNDPGEGAEQRERRDPLGIGGREHDRHRSTFRHPVERGAVEPGSVHHRADVVHPILDTAQAHAPVREPGASLVEHHRSRVFAALLELLRDREVPHQVKVRDKSWNDHQVHGSVAIHGVRDREISALRVLHLGSEHLATFPDRAAFLRERGHSLGGVFGLRVNGERALQVVERGVGVHLERAVERIATPPQHERRL